MIIEGSIAVKDSINNHKREVKLVHIDKKKRTKDFNYIRKLLKENGIPYKEIESEEFNDITNGRSHGGIIAEVSSRSYDELEEGDIFYLDGIEDPFNLGYIFRTLYAFGVKNVILPLRDYSGMEAQLLKSSAGAFDMLKIKVSDDPLGEISSLKEKGYEAYALKRGDDATDIFDEEFSSKCIFMLGGEKRGISSGLLDICDHYLFISYGSDFRNSLNAAAAADVVATLLYRQRRK